MSADHSTPADQPDVTDSDFRLLVDLHRRHERLGPGGSEETRHALELTGLDRTAPLRVADVGCGTGASALVLAKALASPVTAVDLFPEFLEELRARAERAGLADRVETVVGSLDALPFEERSLDLLWSEGAIYLIGFEEGLRLWRRFLKPGGVLAVTEITWTTDERPAELEAHWQREYPAIDTAAAKLRTIEAAGYDVLGHFMLPPSCWDAYYGPLRAGCDAFLARHEGSEAARSIVEAELREIDLRARFGEYFSYGFYIARRRDDEPNGDRSD